MIPRKPIITTPVPTSLEAKRPHDNGRCGVLVVKRCGKVLPTHTVSWTFQSRELNARRNGFIDELARLGPEHPNYLVILGDIQTMEAQRVRAREEGL